MKDKLYNILKWSCMIAIPAIITFFGVISAELNLEYGETVIIIATAFNTMLGTFLGISNKNYYNSLNEEELSNNMGEYYE